MDYRSDFYQDFFERTLFNLNTYRKAKATNPKSFPFEITQLINSLLGLVVFFREDLHRQKRLGGFFPDGQEEFLCKVDINPKDSSRDFPKFMSDIRHAIAHGHVSVGTTDENNQITSLVFQNRQTVISLRINQIDQLIFLLSPKNKDTEVRQEYSNEVQSSLNP